MQPPAAAKTEPLAGGRLGEPQRSPLLIDLGKDRWAQHIGRAQRNWRQLASIDITQVDGNASRLADLLQRHYHYSANEVERQIGDFFRGIAA